MTDEAFSIVFQDADVPRLRVSSLRGRERLSHPFAFDLVLWAEGGLRASGLVGRSCRLVLSPNGEADRRVIHGVVASARVESDGKADRGFHAHARMVPRLWLSSLGRNSRVFQDLSVPQILAKVFKDRDVPMKARLSRAYPPREYCLQYLESDLAFAHRLMADEGMFYFFQDGEENQTVIVCDHPAHMEPVKGDVPLVHRPDAGMVREANDVDRLSHTRRVRSDSLSLRSIDFTRPRTDLAQVVERASEGAHPGGRTYDHDEDWNGWRSNTSSGSLRLEQVRRDAETFAATSRSTSVAVGARFRVFGAFDDMASREVSAIRVEHRGKQPEVEALAARGVVSTNDAEPIYENSFRFVDAAVAFRPKRPRRRLRQVLETATVVGPAGEDVHTDEHGRVKVKFHWDEGTAFDDKASCWVRASQPWAGSAFGFQFIPRVGMEVLVGFLGGDPDRPVILGSAYNGISRPPFPLPAEKSRCGIRTSTIPGATGHNELAFEDAAGREQVYLRAERDLDTTVGRNHTRLVRGDEEVDVDKSRIMKVGANYERAVFGNEEATVHGSSIEHVLGRRLIVVDGRGAEGDVEAPVDVDRASEDLFRTAEGEGARAWVGPRDAAKTAAGAKALFGWYVEQLPGDYHPLGAASEERLRDLEKGVADAERARSALATTVEDVVKRLGDAPLGQAETEQLTIARAAVGKIQERAKGALKAVTIEAGAFPFDNDVLAPLAAVMRQRLPAAAASMSSVLTWSTHTDSALNQMMESGKALPLQALQPPAAPPIASAALDPGALKFDRPAPTMRGASKRAYLLEIKGGGEIVSDDGFRIRVGESLISMTKKSISISSPQVRVDGKPILMNCPKPPGEE